MSSKTEDDKKNTDDQSSDDALMVNGKPVGDDYYAKGIQYWENIDASLDGMLGGYSRVSAADLKGSRRFLNRFIKPLSALVGGEEPREKRRGIDCGCGIGRITKNLLLDYMDVVDLVDCNQAFLDEAKNQIGPQIFESRIGQRFCTPLHEFFPPSDVKYDLVWIQWVTGYLVDGHFVDLLKRFKKALAPNGLVIIKDNHSSDDQLEEDPRDSSVIRPRWLLKDIFTKSGLNLIAEPLQTGLPRELYPVRMFALRDGETV
ncbi:N-terminal methyltransferase [Brevipalpus obovatus]|uniref:N-terminal methyltransferase n=1 Tax=Brevipalpus obovatus TaxID=246614 RepID=UPI003D9E2495